MPINDDTQSDYIKVLIPDADSQNPHLDNRASWTGTMGQSVPLSSPIAYTFDLQPYQASVASTESWSENTIEIGTTYQDVPEKALLQWANYAGLHFQKVTPSDGLGL